MRNKKYYSLYALILLLLSSCQGGSKSSFDYSSLYTDDSLEKFSEQTYLTNHSKYGYYKNNVNGYNNWWYLSKNGYEYQEMFYQNDKFIKNNCYIKNNEFHNSSSIAILRYKAIMDGEITIFGNACVNSTSGTLKLFINQVPIYQLELDTTVRYFEYKYSIKVNDEIDSCVIENNKKSFINIGVTYENGHNKSLYHKTMENKYYGDVFPYYDDDENQLYLWYLQSDDARNGNYNFKMELSKDLLNYRSISEITHSATFNDYYHKARLEFIHDCNKFIDRSKYKYGVRDCRLYYEEDNKRFILIAGCYYQFDTEKQLSDLVIYTSKDEFGFEWNEGIVIKKYDKILPECPSLRKIGNRYYVFVSEAYKTVHQVGQLQYWIGDANKDVADVKWDRKEVHYLDGEDLCVARPFKVKDKTYMFGWIPRTYNTMPWAPWGGYLNLPREIIQRKDGSLGARLDPTLTKILDFGTIINKDKISFSGDYEFSNTFERNLITFDVNMKYSNSAGFQMKQGDDIYQVMIKKEKDKTYLSIVSPHDPLHKINSTLEIDSTNKYSFKIVCDGEFIEAFINDSYSLTGHTSMKNAPYKASLVSDKEVIISNLNISKLSTII